MSQPPRAFRAQYGTVLEITLETLRHDPELRLCEGIRLIETTRRWVGRQLPEFQEAFDREVLPRLRSALNLRFGLPDDGPPQ